MTSTTAPSTPSWGKLSRAWLIAAAVLAVGSFARAEGIQVREAQIESGEEGYTLTATFDIAFSPTLEEALNRGVALNFVVEFELIRPRWYWFDQVVVSTRREWRLAYNALTRQYRLSSGPLYQNLEHFDDAKQLLSNVRGLPVGERGQFSRGTTYKAAVRMRLDVSRLPKPFQVSAITGKEWNLASDWHEFAFTP